MRRLLSRGVVAALLLSVGMGCATAPGPGRPTTLQDRVEIPEAWETSTEGDLPLPPPTEAWWTAFADARIDSVVEEALAHNPSVGIALANVEAARANVTIAGAGRWPQLEATSGVSRRKQIFVGLPFPGPGPASSLSNSYSLGLQSSWEIDLWNRLGQQARASVAQWQASQADLEGARLSVAAQSIRAWSAVIESRRLRELAERTVETYAQTLRHTQSRYERGLTSSLDLHLARTQWASAQALLEERQTAEDRSRRQLEILLGRYPRAALEEHGDLPPLRPLPPAGLPGDLLLRRPDLVAAERRLTASGALLTAARRDLLPRLSLSSSVGTTSDQLSDLLDGNFSIWSIAGNLVQPLFQGGRLRARVQAQRAAQRASLEQYATTALQAFEEVENALDAEAGLAAREAALRRATASARRAADLSEARYRRGVGDFLVVLESQRRFLEAETQLVSLEAQRLRQRVDLHVALGGGLSPTPPTSSPSSTTSR